MHVRKTKSGWVVEIHSAAYGMAEIDGVTGREELYKRATLASVGIGYDDDPAGMYNEFVTNLEALRYWAAPDRLLKRGWMVA